MLRSSFCWKTLSFLPTKQRFILFVWNDKHIIGTALCDRKVQGYTEKIHWRSGGNQTWRWISRYHKWIALTVSRFGRGRKRFSSKCPSVTVEILFPFSKAFCCSNSFWSRFPNKSRLDDAETGSSLQDAYFFGFVYANEDFQKL